MNRGLVYFVIGVLVGIAIHITYSAFLVPVAILPVFSPTDGHEVISLIDNAHNSIDIEVYLFTSKDVLRALEDAKSRGVTIRIIIEKRVISGQNGEMYNALVAKGFDVRYASTTFQLTHAKFMVIDGQTVLVGSHNFSNSALYDNREASVIFSDPSAVARFREVFENDWRIAL